MMNIDDNEILRYLGARPGAAIDGLEAAKRRVLEAAAPRRCFGVFGISRVDGGIQLINTPLLLTGKAIAALLANSARCAVFAVTLGLEADRLIARAQAASMAEAVLLDAAASAAAEALAEDAQAELAARFTLTKRYSPGYGDLPLAVQPALLAAIDAARRIGLTCNPGGLMTPIKSVTAVMGITESGAGFDACAFCDRRQDCGGDACGAD